MHTLEIWNGNTLAWNEVRRVCVYKRQGQLCMQQSTARAGLDHSVKLFKHINKICNGSGGQVNKVVVHVVA